MSSINRVRRGQSCKPRRRTEMATNITSDNPLQPPPASPVEIGDVKPATSVPRAAADRTVLRLCDAATKLRETERLKNRVAERIVHLDSLHLAKQRWYDDLQAHPRVGLGDYGGREHCAALEAYGAASKTYEKAKKRLSVLKELLEKMEKDMIIPEYVVKVD